MCVCVVLSTFMCVYVYVCCVYFVCVYLCAYVCWNHVTHTVWLRKKLWYLKLIDSVLNMEAVEHSVFFALAEGSLAIIRV